MQPSDILRMISVRDPRVSPDGTTVAFVVSRLDGDANRYRSAVWLAAADGSAPPFQLTSGEHADGSPAWSPDGTRIAFTSSRGTDGRGTLHVLRADGRGEPVTLLEREEGVEGPVWSPDGTRIAFVSRVRARRYRDGDDDRARPPRRIDRLFARLDGTGWTVDRPAHVFVVAADGLSEPVCVTGGATTDHSGPAWTPDGERLVVSAVREGGDLDTRADLWLVGGGERELLTSGPLSWSHPAVSPDGRFVAAVAEDALLVPSNGQLVVLDRESGSQRCPAEVLDRTCTPFPGTRAPIWDGGALLFAIEDRGDVHVLRVPADATRAPEVLVDGTRVVGGYDLAGGTLAFTAWPP